MLTCAILLFNILHWIHTTFNKNVWFVLDMAMEQVSCDPCFNLVERYISYISVVRTYYIVVYNIRPNKKCIKKHTYHMGHGVTQKLWLSRPAGDRTLLNSLSGTGYRLTYSISPWTSTSVFYTYQYLPWHRGRLEGGHILWK